MQPRCKILTKFAMKNRLSQESFSCLGLKLKHHQSEKKSSDQKQLRPGIYNWPSTEHNLKSMRLKDLSLCTVWLGAFRCFFFLLCPLPQNKLQTTVVSSFRKTEFYKESLLLLFYFCRGMASLFQVLTSHLHLDASFAAKRERS